VYSLKLGTLDNIEAAETEWVLRPYMNTARKRQFLAIQSMDDDDDEEETEITNTSTARKSFPKRQR
jgi:hypothetical protein